MGGGLAKGDSEGDDAGDWATVQPTNNATTTSIKDGELKRAIVDTSEIDVNQLRKGSEVYELRKRFEEVYEILRVRHRDGESERL